MHNPAQDLTLSPKSLGARQARELFKTYRAIPGKLEQRDFFREKILNADKGIDCPNTRSGFQGQVILELFRLTPENQRDDFVESLRNLMADTQASLH